jgi:FKBP-type peptidyl-prolyl cis-trans isomerase FkpA
MNRISKFASVLSVAVFTAFYAIAGQPKTEFKVDPASGVKYMFIKHNPKGEHPVMGDIAFVRIVYKRDDDSVLFDSHTMGHSDSSAIIPLSLQKSFHGSLEDGIALMSTGDSACFLVSADSVYLKAFKLKVLPMFIKPGSTLKFYIKLIRFETLKQMKDDQYAMIEKRRQESKKAQATEAVSIQTYLANNNIKVKPWILDSMYVLQRTGTIGRQINEGDSVEVKYTGMLLDGTVFDQSDKGDGGKGTFTIQFKSNMQLIRGWIAILSTMHEEEKVRVLLPSCVGYGPNAPGKEIKPYTPLLFEIEVVKVISPLDK